MNDAPVSPRKGNRSLDHIEVALWVGLLAFGSWVAFEWMTAAPPAPPAAPEPPAAALFPSELIEAEGLIVRAASRPFEFSLREVAALEAGGWSRDAHMQARGVEPGDFIELGLPQRYPGDYRVVVFMSRAPGHGIVAFSLGGKRIGDEVNLHGAQGMLPTGAISLGIATLEGRRDRLRIEVVGPGGGSSGGLDFALDGVLLERVVPRN